MTQWNFGYGDTLVDIKGAGWVADDNLHNISQSLYGNAIKLPTPVSCKLAASEMSYLPTLANDGGQIRLPVASDWGGQYFNDHGDYIKVNADNVPQWAVDQTDINAAADMWAAHFWYDSVDVALWVIAINTDTAPYTNYLARIADNGNITNVGSFQSDDFYFLSSAMTKWSSGMYFARDAHGSGNFTAITKNGYRYTISSADGSILSGPVAFTMGGVQTAYPGYLTLDGSIMACFHSGYNNLVVQRNGGISFFNDLQTLKLMIGGDGSSFNILIVEWGGNIAFCEFHLPTNVLPQSARLYDRADFDRWLTDLADISGL